MIRSGFVLERFDLSQLEPAERLHDGLSSLNGPPTDLPPPFVSQTTQDQDAASENAEADEGAEIIGRLHSIVDDLARQATAARDRAAKDMADGFADATSTLLPSLIDEYIREEIAAAALRVALATQPEEIGVSLHPDDCDAVIGHLKALDPPAPIAVSPDASVAAGTASLHWDRGGATIDHSTLISEARAVLDARHAVHQPKALDHDQ